MNSKKLVLHAKLLNKSIKIFRDPYLLPNETPLFLKYLDQAKIYFEYGSGSSTHQAAKRGLKIITAEIGYNWIVQLQKEIQIINSFLGKEVNITYLYSEFPTTEGVSYENFLNYIHMYDHHKYQADLIYLDGHYLMSCLFNIINQIDSNTYIYLHDMHLSLQRKQIRTIKHHFDIIDQCERSYVLKKKITIGTLSDKFLNDIYQQEFNISNTKTQMFSLIKHFCNDTINKYKNYDDLDDDYTPVKHVWFLWFQGMESAPRVVKMCLSAIKRNLPNASITVINKDNIFKIVNFPSYIIYRLNNTVSKTHLADILRNALLAKYGGLWIDATIFAAKEVSQDIFNYPFYTNHLNHNFPFVTGKWCIFVLYSSRNNIVPKFCSEIINEFLKYFVKFPKYFFYDFVMMFGYEYIPSFKRMIQLVPYNNPNVLSIISELNQPYSKEKWDSFVSDTTFFKLTWKQRLHKNKNHSLTLFGHFLTEYNID